MLDVIKPSKINLTLTSNSKAEGYNTKYYPGSYWKARLTYESLSEAEQGALLSFLLENSNKLVATPVYFNKLGTEAGNPYTEDPYFTGTRSIAVTEGSQELNITPLTVGDVSIGDIVLPIDAGNNRGYRIITDLLSGSFIELDHPWGENGTVEYRILKPLNQVIIKGLTGTIEIGDYITINNHLKFVTTGITTGSEGTLEFEPPFSEDEIPDSGTSLTFYDDRAYFYGKIVSQVGFTFNNFTGSIALDIREV